MFKKQWVYAKANYVFLKQYSQNLHNINVLVCYESGRRRKDK